MPDPIVHTKLVLPNPRFKRGILSWIDGFIDGLPPGNNARQFEAERSERQSEALAGLRAYIAELEHTDPRFYVLAQAIGNQVGEHGWIHKQSFEPTPSARRIFYALGLGGVPTNPEATFAMIVSGAVADTIRAHVAHNSKLDQARKAALEDRDRAQAQTAALEARAAEADTLTAQLEEANREAARQGARIADLEGFLALVVEDKRRVKIEGETGIYQAASKEHGQLVYEIGYREDGKQRWHRLPPDATIEDARAERARFAEVEVEAKSDPDPDPEPEQGGQSADADDKAEGASPGSPGDDAADETTEPDKAAVGEGA